MNDTKNTLSGRRVLVVDDSVGITSLLKEVFTDADASVTVANEGEQAMRCIVEERFDLVILDLIMPKPDGWDVLERIHRQRPELLRRTLVLTGDRYRPTARQLRDGEGVEMLYKPFDIEELRLKAAAMLQPETSLPSSVHRAIPW